MPDITARPGCHIPEYRLYPTVRRYPVVLAFIARHVLNGAVEDAPR
jgi:hypothetical protein